MELTNIKDLFREKEQYKDKKVTVGGWVRSNRDSKNFGFLVVNDGTFFEPLQIVYGSEMENFGDIAKIGVGAAVVVTGKNCGNTRSEAADRNACRGSSCRRAFPGGLSPAEKASQL